MAIEGYAEAIHLERIEKQLARCAAHDDAYPPDVECARKAALDSVCPCMLCEDTICNVLTDTIYEHMTGVRSVRS
ncbi:MAG TPA: hypothetical protein VF275_04420 [Gammaproteobacteria bacterium]